VLKVVYFPNLMIFLFYRSSRGSIKLFNPSFRACIKNRKAVKVLYGFIKGLKAAYGMCCDIAKISEQERNYINFYIAIRFIF
jgi:hypothetical protein